MVKIKSKFTSQAPGIVEEGTEELTLTITFFIVH
jgi:hypothetical protein